MVARWRSLQQFDKFMIVVTAGLVAWFSYVTIAWLVSSHPVGALVPGVFVYFFGASLYAQVRYESLAERAVHSWSWIVITGAASAASIAILWSLAGTRDDAVYHDQAVSMSLWGGATVVAAIFILVVSATPRGRQRIRDQRGELTRQRDVG